MCPITASLFYGVFVFKLKSQFQGARGSPMNDLTDTNINSEKKRGGKKAKNSHFIISSRMRKGDV